jgi:miniconductance mechanosensitive channel
VRQLPPAAEGLPIEIYVFSGDKRWVAYEDIQSDIFDHILAVIPEFDLRVYQHPSGKDVQEVASFGRGLGAIRQNRGG